MKKTLTGSTLAKIIAFFLLAISYLVGCAGSLATMIMADSDLYDYDENENSRVKKFMYSEIARDFVNLRGGADFCVLNDVTWISNYCQNNNLDVKLVSDEGTVIYSTYAGRATEVEKGYFEYIYNFSAYLEKDMRTNTSTWFLGTPPTYQEPSHGETEYEVFEAEATVIEQNDFWIYMYVNPEFPVNDRYYELAETARTFYRMRYVAPAVAIVGILCFMICFIFLMCAAGHHNDGKNAKEGITPSLLNAIPLDLLTAAYIMAAIMGIALGASFAAYTIPGLVIALLVFGVAEVVCGTIFCMEWAIRLKLGSFWKNTIICAVLRFCHKLIRALVKGLTAMVKGIPFVVDILLVFFGICIFEFFGLMIWGSGELAVLWMLEKVVMLLAVVYFSLMWRRLKKGSEALAAGDLQYKVNTSHMVWDFKAQGENLNQIAKGINTAVEQRMKSERLKTELITNVSHDLKTPLTSIINYADLIASCADDSEKITEYSQVLLRQSKRLKKLLDDLMEASKATTGNLEVALQPCEIDVLLTQAVGEYEQRFEEKQLKLITRQPEGQIRVMADGRHLWRVFDNLLNNICKYALENSRVYLTVETKDNKVNIIFRNISKYILEVSGEELEERFVRGDKSRHMEGNGLGLSIAKSLMGLQGGEMEIVTDGDLFKVILTFTML